VYADLQEVSGAAAAWVAEELVDRVGARGRASLVLSGGSTPQTLYELLAARFANRVPWHSVDVFWSDERYLPHDHSLSNYRLAKEALLDRVAIPADQVHPMPTHYPDPHAAADDYESAVTRYFAGTPVVFDLLLLGIGADGHVASVFPGSTAITSGRIAVAVTAPAEPPSRLTLTLPVLAAGRRVGVLATGRGKAAALAATLGGGNPQLPAAVLARTASTLVWWLDREAWPERSAGIESKGVTR
jgi:6-phosphogluconolactonase